MYKNPFPFIILLYALVMTFMSCTVSFKGYSIDPSVKTFTVGNFKTTAANAPATINQTFSESFKDKISRESKLDYTETTPDIEFNGTIQSFLVTSVAPQPGERTAFNRLTIHVSIDYVNHQNAKDTWIQTFSHFADFPVDQNLLQVQDDLIAIIFNQVQEDIFNKAFNNW